MKSKLLFRLLSDYGLVLVLIALGTFFSTVTWKDQFPHGEAAAQQLADEIREHFGKGVRVLIASRADADEVEFAGLLGKQVEIAGGTVTATVTGESPDAREALRRMGLGGGKLDVIATSEAAATWPAFANVNVDFSTLGRMTLLHPHGYRWPSFLLAENLGRLLDQFAVIGIVALGLTAVVIAGGFDLSIGGLIALGAVLSAVFVREHAGGAEATPNAVGYAVAATVLICGAFGAVSGAAVGFCRLPSFIVTLAISVLASGFALEFGGSRPVSEVPASFAWGGHEANVFGVPNVAVVLVACYALAFVFMERTTLGRYLRAVGGGAEAARLAGVPVRRVVFGSFVASGLLAGFGGVVLASQMKGGSAGYAEMDDFYVIAAVLAGGASVSGGEGRILGTLIGSATIAVLVNGMAICALDKASQKVVLGLVIVAALLLDWFRQQLRAAGRL